MPNYQDINLRKRTKGSEGFCNCFICLKGRYCSRSKVIKGRGNFRNVNMKIDSSNGLNSNSKIYKLPVRAKIKKNKIANVS